MAMDRRGFLGALALVPAAVAACSTGGAAGRPRLRPAGGAAAGQAPGAGPAVTGGLAAVRGFALPGTAEPAFTFRAAVSRPGER